jgi:hypothetical protein
MPNKLSCKWFQYFGLKENDVPLLFVIAQGGKYLNPTIDPDQVIPWLKEYIVEAFSTLLCFLVTELFHSTLLANNFLLNLVLSCVGSCSMET